MDNEYVPLEKLEIYSLSMEIGEIVWRYMEDWDNFQKNTIGKQLIRASDSIAANIAEGYGRYHYKDRLLFCYYSRGSMMETITWLKKSKTRNLITDNQYETLKSKILLFHLKLNTFIKKLRQSTQNK